MNWTQRTIALVIGLGLGAGCASSSEERKPTIQAPESALAPEYQVDGPAASQRYVIRMSDGSRDWEIEFPEQASGAQVEIPLKGGGAPGMQWEESGMTDADRELLDQVRRENGDVSGQGVFRDGQNVTNPDGTNNSGGALPGAELNKDGKQVQDPGKADAGSVSPGSKPSYLLGREEIKRLYRSGNYELAMVRLKQLEKAYPNDAELLSMKGTLWLQLGNQKLAREAWEQALQIDPDNRSVIEALKRLNSTNAQ